MKIALIGYGKMGQIIERIALERGHEIALKIDAHNRELLTKEQLQQVDTAIEFTTPHAALDNVSTCFEAGVPVVCGTTGWNNELALARERCLAGHTAFLQTSNFSVGVNIFFAINKRLASLMNQQPTYSVAVEEIHHTQKKDSPSGTAISIAEQIIAAVDRKTSWSLEAGSAEELPITALREEGVPGTHTVTYDSAVDRIDIIHTAHNRDGFALGAVLAAEFIAGKKGIFTMSNVLGI